MATKRPRFRPNRRGIGQMLNSAQMEAAMVARARGFVSEAQRLAVEHVQSGAYISSFEVTSRRDGGVNGDRAEAVARNTAGHAAAVEFGNSQVPAQRIMGRAAEGGG